MPDFAYVARDMKGQRKTGTLTANSQRDVIAQLDALALFPVEVKASKGVSTIRTKRVGGVVMANAYNQLASLLRSGVPMIRALTVMGQQASKPTLKAVLEEVKLKVEDGESLSTAMARFPRVFNDMAVNMVRAGAEGGFLEDALERVASFTETQEDMKGRAMGALAYPIFLGCVGSAIVLVLLIFFVPNFEPLFATLREKDQLPWATDALLDFSKFLQNYWWMMAAGMAAMVFAAVRFLNSDAGRIWLDWAKIKVPMFGSIFLNLAVARFCRVLGTLLANGVPILKSLDISRNAAGNRILSTAIEKASQNITAGEKLATPLAASGHFPPQVTEMIAVAEESNSLDRVMIQISDSLERTTFRRLDMMVRLLEPVMLLVMAMLVFFIVLALMVPLLNSSSTV
jgi:type II secretory pathway component PulF